MMMIKEKATKKITVTLDIPVSQVTLGVYNEAVYNHDDYFLNLFRETLEDKLAGQIRQVVLSTVLNMAEIVEREMDPTRDE